MKYYVTFNGESGHCQNFERYIHEHMDDLPSYYSYRNDGRCETYEIEFPDNRDVFEFMQERESKARQAAEYIPWFTNDGQINSLPFIPGLRMHFVRPALSDPSKLAYYQSIEHFLAGRLSIIKPGKYLQKYYGHVISSDAIQQWSEQWRKLNSPEINELHFAKTPEEFLLILMKGPLISSAAIIQLKSMQQAICSLFILSRMARSSPVH